MTDTGFGLKVPVAVDVTAVFRIEGCGFVQVIWLEGNGVFVVRVDGDDKGRYGFSYPF